MYHYEIKLNDICCWISVVLVKLKIDEKRILKTNAFKKLFIQLEYSFANGVIR